MSKEVQAVATYEALIARERALKCLPPRKGDGWDASPGAIRGLKADAEADAILQAILDAATTPAPLRPALSRVLVDAWSMTSLKEHTGRPEIDPWLRGWVEDDKSQTAVVWRTHLPVRTRGSTPTKSEIEAFFEAAPSHASELMETETFRVVEWLAARAKALVEASARQTTTAPQDGKDSESAVLRRDGIAAVVLTTAGDLRTVPQLGNLAPIDNDKDAEKKRIADLHSTLASAVIIVDARLCGLKDGLLDDESAELPRTIDDGKQWLDTIRFRVRTDAASPGDPKVWRERLRFATELSEDGEATRVLIVEKWRHDAATEED